MTDTGDLAAPLRTLKPVNLIPVSLKEAAWDSPSFRAYIIHAFDQVEAAEKWIENCIRTTTRLTSEVSTLESLLNAFFSSAVPPSTLSEAIVDHDYSLVAAKRFGDASKDAWIANVAELKKLDTNIVEPLKQFGYTELRSFKECRRVLEQTQKVFDQLQLKYSAQAKTKEPSSLQQVAFQLHDARKAYLKASLDFAVALPQLKLAFDKVLARVFSDQMCAMQASRDATSIVLTKYASDVRRIRSWSKEIESSEKAFRKELQNARVQIEEAAELASRPSREVEDYASVSTSIKGPTTGLPAKPSVTANGKQGWLNMKLITGKPARTIWIRRWFFVKNGVFGWLVQGMRSGGVEESDRIGVLLCGLRPATSEERRFCFEVKTKDITIVLQADSQSELTQWMAAFDIAKQKALEEPASNTTETSSQPLDLAFAISPPSSIEFTANSADVGLTSDDSHDRSVSGSLSVPQDPTSPTHRGSFDVNAVRRSSGFDSDSNSQAGRGPRKSSGISQPGNLGGMANPSAGIASLISAGNITLPLGAGVAFQAIPAEGSRSFTNPTTKMPLNSVIRTLPKSTLAPSTLVNPPVSTNLSNATVVLNSEKGNLSAQMDLVKGTPSGMMANSWGSLNWAYNNSLSRSGLPIPEVEELNPTKSGPNSPEKKPLGSIGRDQNVITSRGHRKTVSLDGDAADLQRTIISPGTFPNYYPTILKYHDAQFRVLFPSVPRDEKLAMVFRATWNPSEHGDFPGRIYVTPQTVYSYINHMGLIFTSSLSLRHVAEITAAPGRECDYLFLHLKPSPDVQYTRITVKVFLEPLKLLEKRLSYLVENANSDNPDSLETVMNTMLKFEQPEPGGRSPSIDSTDEQDIPVISARGPQLNGKDLRTKLRIDQDILGLRKFDDKEKLRLPSRPVTYVPNGMTDPVVEMNFKISPKALFHILYGDRSVIWQLLYHQCGAQNIQQGPWLKPEEGYYRRIFSYRMPAGASTGLTQDLQVEDSQTLDVFSDHLCYVVTERRSAWYLPINKQFELVIKVVITYNSKSNCKLAIYTDVHWIKPSIFKPLVDHHALAALRLDALDLMDVAAEQVNRIGHHVQSKKAIQIFGQIGQETQTVEFKSADSNTIPRTRHVSQRKSIRRLFLDAYGAFIAGCVNIVLAQVIAIFDWVVKTFNANFWLVLFFALSLLINAFFSSGLAISWWQDLQAGRYMKTLGISNDLVITRVINLSDMDLLTSSTDHPYEDNLCYQTFKKTSSFASPSSASPTFSRLRNTQRVLGTYRHDLVVALRMVNSMEQGLVQAEWEYWLDEEVTKCSTAAKVLANGSDAAAGSSGMDSSKNDTVQRLRRYCNSCKESRKVLREG